jgi:hypothetical protein
MRASRVAAFLIVEGPMAARIGMIVLVAAMAANAFAQQQPAPKPAPTQQVASAESAAPSGPLKSASLGLVPYPAKQQSPAQQSKDDQECFDWSKQSTGIDPTQKVAAEQSAAAQPQKGTRLKGAVKGAAAGAVVGEVVDDKAGEGAGVGAAAGAVRSGRKEKERAAEAQKEAEAQAEATQTARLDTFRKGYSACMQTRGYTLK